MIQDFSNNFSLYSKLLTNQKEYIMKKASLISFLLTVTFLFVSCGGGNNEENSCENLFQASTSTPPSLEVGESISNINYKDIAGYTITGKYEGKIFSVEFQCNHTHTTTIDNDIISQGSFVADYDNTDQQIIYLYNGSGETTHTIVLQDYAIDLNQSTFDNTGKIISITKTSDCTEYEASEAINYGIKCNPSNFSGYIFCTYEFYLNNANTVGYWQYQAFAASLNNAEKLTESINRQGGHVDLTDGAEELKVFQRGDDVTEGIYQINNESTLIVRQDNKDDVELKYNQDAPDNRARDILMTYTDSPFFKVHLKEGKGIAPTNRLEATCTDPDQGCPLCYGNHCLDVYDLGGNSKGMYRGTHITYGFYAPAAGFTCQTDPKEENTLMTTINQEFAPPKNLNEENDNNDDGAGENSNGGLWNIDVTFDGRFGTKEWHWTNIKTASTTEALKTTYDANYPFPYMHEYGGTTLTDTSFYDNANEGLILAYYAEAYPNTPPALIQKGYCIDASWIAQEGDTYIGCDEENYAPTWDGISTSLNAEQETSYIQHKAFTLHDTGRWINDAGSSSLTVTFTPIN